MDSESIKAKEGAADAYVVETGSVKGGKDARPFSFFAIIGLAFAILNSWTASKFTRYL